MIKTNNEKDKANANKRFLLENKYLPNAAP